MSLFGQLSGALQSRGESGEANTFPPPPPPPASPQMTVTGNSLLIGAAQAPAFEGNHTDFGDLVEGDPSVSRVFTIANDGTADLLVSFLQAPAGFTVTEGLTATIAPSASDTFTVELPTTTVGLFTGFVSFLHNDPGYPGANPFTFEVVGEVTSPPPPPPTVADIGVTGNGASIFDGDATASATNHTAFGTTVQSGGTITRTFTITNVGGSDLTLSSLTVPTGFTVVEGISATIVASATDTFQVRLDDSVVGEKTGEISFTTNVTGKNPFNFAISGTVSPPPPPPPPPTEPSVALTAPANGDTSTALPITASANATANSPATSIVSAAFRLNGVTVATDNSGPPWSVDLSPDNGTYSVDVVVTDNLGGVNTSAPHTHTVNVSPPAGTTLTTLTIHNSSTTAQTTGFVTKAFAHQFKKADIPNGDYPQFQLTDGTPVPHTHWGKTTWTDGSWQMAGFVLRVPSTVAGARTVTSSGSTLTAASHTDLTTGDPVRFITTNTLPTGINPATTYYVRLGTGTTITVHTTSAGAIANTGAVATSGAGSGTHTLLPGIAINIKNGGSAPAASALTNADITGSSDIKVEGVGGRNITGTNASSLNTGISDGEIFEIGTGPVGRVLRVYQEFNDGSTDNTQAGAYHYVFQLQNGSSGKYGLRHMARMQNGWTDVAGTVLGKTFLSLAVKDGGTTVHTLSKLASTKTLTVLPCGLITTNNSTNIVGYGGAMAVRITSSGTMPAGLSDTTTYYVNTWAGGRYTLAFDAQTANFTVGQIITGATSTATAEIVGIEDLGTTGRLYLKNWSSSKDFRDNEIITDPLGGSATVNEALPFWTATHTLNYDGQTAEFTAGQVLTAANGASATIVGVVDSGATGTLYLRGVSTSASFLNNAVITDALGGSADANGTTASVNLKPTNVITLYTNGYASRTGGTETVVTSAGSGTISMEVVPQLDAFCGGPFTANDAGEYNFIAAGGAGAETTCEVVTNRDYLISTKWWGPRATNLVPTQRASIDYKFEAYQEYTAFRDSSGPRNDIGYFPSYGLEHFHRQTPIDMRRIRVHGLQYGLQIYSLRRDTTKNPVNLTSTTYSNLGASISQNAWTKFGFYGDSGWMTSSVGDKGLIWGEFDYSHYYFPHAYAYAATAEPHYLDMVVDGATNGVLHNSNGRAEIVAGVPYENVIWKNDPSARGNAWTLQALSFARIFAPVAGWNGADLKSYFDEIIDDNLVSNHADKDNGNAFQQTSRVQYTGNTLLQTWQQAYWVKALCFLYGATEKASARDNAEDFLTFWGGIRSNFGLSWLSIPNHIWAEGIPSTHTDWSRLFPSRPWGGIIWDAATDTITYGYNVAELPELGTIENGVQWLQANGVVPGTTIDRRYWVRDLNVGAKTYKLSTNSGLSDVVNITSSGSEGDSTRIYARLTPPYSDTWMSGSGGANDTKYEIYSAARYANAHGFTLPSGLLAAMDAFMATNGPSNTELIASINNHFNATF